MTLPTHKRTKSQIPPHSLSSALHGARNTKCRMLIWYDVVLVFWVRRLVLGRDVDVFDW